MEYFLENVEERNMEAPNTFSIATKQVRANQEIGTHVKLIFELKKPTGKITGERMWVKITKRLRGGRYIGTLANRPFVLEGVLKHGDVIKFGQENVASIEYERA